MVSLFCRLKFSAFFFFQFWIVFTTWRFFIKKIGKFCGQIGLSNAILTKFTVLKKSLIFKNNKNLKKEERRKVKGYYFVQFGTMALHSFKNIIILNAKILGIGPLNFFCGTKIC
jgi:hypothetical protein